MPPVDPKSSTPERDPYEANEADEIEGAADANDLDALRRRADVPGLLALAKARRAGTAAGGRDMKGCLDAYRAAAELGNAEAEFAVALFHMNGGTVVAQDLKEGAMRLRSAAEKGSVPAKVYLGNLYELGIHYKADAEKADVWYRNAARGARIDAEPGSDDWNRALADLGCARQVVALTRDPALDEQEKSRLLARAKAHGHGLRMREDASDSDRATFVDALSQAVHCEGAEASAMTGTPPPVAVDVEPRQRKDTSPETKRAKDVARARSEPPPGPAAAKPLDPAAKAAAERAERIEKKKAADRNARLRAALGAFGYALLFAVAGVGAGYAATLGARELIANGSLAHGLPLIGTKTRLVFPIVLALIGVLPTWLVYKLGTVVKALLLGGGVAGIGWVAWGTGSGAFHSDRALQALAFGLAGFLAGLLVLGLLGGAKTPRPLPRSR